VRLRDAGAHVEVVGLSPAGPLCEQLRLRGITCTALGARGAGDLRAVWRLVRLMRHARVDTVMSFLVHANAVAAMARFVYPHARYFQSIQTTQPWPRWHWAVQRLIAPAARRVFVPSPSVAAVARRWSGVAAGRLMVIPNAVDVGPMTQGRAARGTRIAFVGRLDRVKRVGDLIEAVALLPAAFRLDVYGDGPERPRVERLIAQLNVGDRVALHGVVADSTRALASADALVLPSSAEGFGLVLIEAMAAGVPVVATDVPGIRDVVRHDQTGLLVPVASPTAIAAAVTRLSDAPALRERLVRNARSDVAARFAWTAVMPMYLQMIGLRGGVGDGTSLRDSSRTTTATDKRVPMPPKSS
jgi:glycosyltransferase involved in cell wall biosynthesis